MYDVPMSKDLQSIERCYNQVNPPESGCYIKGLYLEGACWNYQKKIIDEARPKKIFDFMPIISLLPQEKSEKEGQRVKMPATKSSQKDKKRVYECPTYKTTARAGSLSSTGHSTNFILAIQLPSELNEKHWIKRGSAMIASLDD